MASRPPASVAEEGESHEKRLQRSMQLASNMIQAMGLQAVPWGESFSRATLFRAMLWQDVGRRKYFFEVFDLIAYDPEIFVKLEGEELLSDNPEPLLLVADTLWDRTKCLDEANYVIMGLKIRT